MTAADAARLVALAAIWGAGFLFMRIAAPALGGLWTAELRVLLGGLALVLWYRAMGYGPELRRHWRLYASVGAVSTAMPFALFGYAAIHLPASLLAILNATAPMFGLVFGALFLAERVTARRIAGLALGALGVGFVAQPEAFPATPQFALAVAAVLAACAGYGLTGTLMKRYAGGTTPRGMAAGTQLAAALVLVPLLPLSPAPGPVTPLVVLNILALGLLASGAAFVLYFRLIADIGATRALTVTFLIPMFGVFWGVVLLGESLPATALAGGVLIVSGTVLVLRN